MTEHPNAEAAEQRLAEHLTTCDAFPIAVALTQAQARIDRLEAVAAGLADASGAAHPR